MLKKFKRWIVTYVTVELHRRLSFQLVSSQIGVVRGLDVVVGQRVLQLLWVHLSFLDTGSEVVLVHQESFQQREVVGSQSHSLLSLVCVFKCSVC